VGSVGRLKGGDLFGVKRQGALTGRDERGINWNILKGNGTLNGRFSTEPV